MSASIVAQLEERRVEQAAADMQLLREAYDLGQITWRALVDAATSVALIAIPDLRVIDVDAEPAAPRKCACGNELPPRCRKCDDCVAKR